jgi:hypothetical protein
VLKVPTVVVRVQIIVLRVQIIVLRVQIIVLRVQILVRRVRIIVPEDAGRVAAARCAAFAPVVASDIPTLRSRASCTQGYSRGSLGTQGP